MKRRHHLLLSLFVLAIVFCATALSPARAEAATNVYYSVGQNTSDHKTGSPTITISSGVATFSVAQTATNMGVGDKVTYNGSSVAYISGKISTTQWNVITATGGTPANVSSQTVNSIAHAFASLNAAIGGLGSGSTDASHLNTTNLVTGNYILNIPCYYDSGADTGGNFLIRDFTTGASNYLRIYTATSTATEVNQSQRHSGVWSSTKYNLAYTDTAGFTIYNNQDFVRIDGIQIKVTSSIGSSNHAILATAQTTGSNGLVFSNNIIVGVYSGGSNGHGIVSQDSNNNASIYNNIIYGFNGASGSAGISSYGTTYAYNNTLYNNGRGLNHDSGPFVIAKNNIAYNNTTDYSGFFNSKSTGNLSKDASAPNTNTFYRNKTLTFVSTTGGSENLHLAAGDSDAIGKGINLNPDVDGYLSFNTDIDDQTRASTWDVGADYFVDVTAPVISSINAVAGESTSTISWTTDESATSTVEYGLTASYGSASSSASLVTTRSIYLSGLAASTLYHYRVSSTDGSGNRSVSSDGTFTTTARTVPPVRSAGAPSTIRSAGTTSQLISLTTDENATCKYSTASSTAYASMTNTFSTTGGTSHSTTVSGLVDGTRYHYYVRCQDSTPNTNTDDYDITFRVADSGTLYAYSTSYADVSEAIGLAGSGDTVMVPAGTSTWPQEIDVMQPITIMGAGTTTTKLIAGGTMPHGFFYVHGIGTSTAPLSWVSTPIRITGFFFEMLNQSVFYGISIRSVAINNLRIDHNAFNFGGTEQIEVTGSKGVIDNNYFINGVKAIGFTAGTRDQADDSWVSMAAGTSDALFIEGNYIIDNASYSAPGQQEKIATDNGGKLVIRYNTFDFTGFPLGVTSDPFMSHGSADGGCNSSPQIGYWQYDEGSAKCIRRGQSVVEVYNNLMKGPRIDHPVTVRGSANLIHNNVITLTGGFTPQFLLREEEFDNTGVIFPIRTAWPAEDQVHNTFIWNNTYNGGSMQSVANIATSTNGVIDITLNKDYFLHAPCGASDITDLFGNTCTHGKETFTGMNGASGSYPTDGSTYPTYGTMVFTPTGDNAYYGYTPYTCPNPITGLANGCNSASAGASAYDVNVSGAPSVTTSAASSIARTTATLNGSITATGGANATQSGFAYGTVSNLSTVIATSTLGSQVGTASFNSSISSLTCGTTYYFRAYATNTNGTGYGSIISFTTLPCDPVLLTSTASSITQTTATASSTVTSTGTGTTTVSVRGFAYGLTTAYGATTTESGNFSTGPLSASLTGLTCNTLYHIRSYATNIGGTGYGSDGTFTTSACAQTVTTSAASSVATSTATLNGSISSTGGADATQSGFAYGTVSNLSTVIATSTLGAQSGTASFSTNITGLTPNTTYYVRAYTTNTGGTSYGSIQSFTTSAVTAPSVTTSAATSLTQTTATLNGSITATGGNTSTQSGFAYGTSATLSSVIATSTLGVQGGTASFSTSVSSLTCNTTYYFRAYATNTGGTGYGSIVSFTTSACAPTVTTQAASSLTNASATLNGNITATGGANPTDRGFAYGLTTAYGATTTESGSFSTGAYTGSASGLACNTLYHVKAYATNSGGTSFGSDQTFTTSACAAPSVTTSAASSITKTTASLNGSITATGGNDATQSGFAYGTSSSLSTVIATSTLGAQSGTASFSSSISSLTCETTYYARAYATNITGTGYGSIVSFTASSCTDPVVAETVTVAPPSTSAARRAANLVASLFSPAAAPSAPAAARPTPTLRQFVEVLISVGAIPQDKAEAAKAAVSVSTPASALPRTDLSSGSNGASVRTLQNALVERGYLKATPNGVFGPATKAALQAFQKANGVPATGYYGPLTRAAMGR